MKHPLIDAVEKKYRRENELDFGIGETVRVTIKIVEGNKERLQDFEGVVIARKGSGLDEMFTVRRLVGNEGVERTFQTYSPLIAKIEVKRRGDVRRAKLYYLRGLSGKKARIKEKLPGRVAKQDAAA